MAANKNYISKGFQDRIEVSLANISTSQNDKFAIVKMKYVPSSFKCELCGHEPCLYAFSIKNLETGIVIDVGSECVNHFKGECDIDVAEGLKKRIKSVTRKMRRYMKNNLEEEQYKDMTPETKRELTLKLFMKHQAIEALKGESNKKTLLKKEDVLRIIEDTPEIPHKEPKRKRSNTPLSAAKKEVRKLTKKREANGLSEDEKKTLKNAQERVRYHKTKVA